MIVFRYLAREVLISMLAVSSVLLLITLSARFVKYLAQAASGKLAADVLFAIMGYRLPGFLELVLPLGLFIAILLAYGRLYMESEMTVLSACGVSQTRLVAYTLIPAFGVALVVAGLSLFASPLSAQRVEAILDTQRARTEFESLTPARFQEMQGGQSVTYAEKLSTDHKRMFQVFMAEMADESPTEEDEDNDDLSVIMAKTGEQFTDRRTGQRYLLLKEGYRYQGRPGEADYRVTRFDEYAQRLEEAEGIDQRPTKSNLMPTSALLRSEKQEDKAELQWRFSIPVLVLVVVLLAVPLAKTNPRQGRYAKMIPAILLYIIYLVALNAIRGAIGDNRLPAVAMWGVHAVFLALALLLLGWDWLWNQLIRPPKGGARAQT